MRTEVNVRQNANHSPLHGAVSPNAPAAHKECDIVRFHRIGIQAVAAAVAQLKAKPTTQDHDEADAPLVLQGNDEA